MEKFFKNKHENWTRKSASVSVSWFGMIAITVPERIKNRLVLTLTREILLFLFDTFFFSSHLKITEIRTSDFLPNGFPISSKLQKFTIFPSMAISGASTSASRQCKYNKRSTPLIIVWILLKVSQKRSTWTLSYKEHLLRTHYVNDPLIDEEINLLWLNPVLFFLINIVLMRYFVHHSDEWIPMVLVVIYSSTCIQGRKLKQKCSLSGDPKVVWDYK